MSSFDKTVKLACKPKAAPPKAKYLDPIVAATWADEGSVSDICRALAPRFREPNAVVVFKALIVLHTIIRNGSTDNVLSYLSSSDVLRLRNVSAGSWDGYAAPQNLQHYAMYLDMRIRAYRELKHDAIRVQAENNRDLRNSMSIEEESYRGRKQKAPPKNNGIQRSKTIMGRKLGSMPVEKGLLRETRMVQKMIASLVECRFYLDSLEDQLTIYALRMLVKDLLILVQACNEGVINVLENYFEMSRSDARQALELYRHFCKQTGHIDEYLGVAKKLQNLLSVPIPSLKSAPNSLAGALQEYLDDPNFEQNRQEYKVAKTAAARNAKNPMPTKADENQSQHTPSQSSSSTKASAPTAVKTEEKDVIDFFAAIEEERPKLQANSVVLGPGPHNPFSQMVFGNVQPAPQFAMQPTGQMLPQHTAIPQIFPQHTAIPSPPNAFGVQSFQLSPGQPPFSSLGPSQPTGLPQSNQGPPNPFSQPQQQHMGNNTLQQSYFPTSQLRPQATGFLQSQPTGSNPFRQSTLLPQSTGMALFGVGATASSGPPNPVGMLNANPAFSQSQSAGAISAFSAPVSTTSFPPAPSFGQQSTQSNLPPRPASTPLTSLGQTQSSPSHAQPVQTHQTGSRNPFGPITKTSLPVPKEPTLMELAMGVQNNGSAIDSSARQPAQNAPVMNTFPFTSSALDPGATDISSVASSFSMKNRTHGTTEVGGISGLPLNPQTTASGSTQTSSLFSSTISSQPTGTSSASGSLFSSTGTSRTFSSSMSSSQTSASSPTSPSMPSGPPQVKSHMTGFTGLKPFKPTSSFGAALLESLPPIPDNASTPPTTTQSSLSSPTSPTPSAFSQQPGLGTLNTQQTGFRTQPTGAFGGFNPGSTVGQGLRPQMTGGGASNPFRASMAVPSMTGAPTLPPFPATNGFATSSPSFAMPGMQPTGANFFGPGGSGFMSKTPGQPQPQQQSSQSLI
ncbi:ANTH domain containing protein [Amanita muscaria]